MERSLNQAPQETFFTQPNFSSRGSKLFYSRIQFGARIGKLFYAARKNFLCTSEIFLHPAKKSLHIPKKIFSPATESAPDTQKTPRQAGKFFCPALKKNPSPPSFPVCLFFILLLRFVRNPIPQPCAAHLLCPSSPFLF